MVGKNDLTENFQSINPAVWEASSHTFANNLAGFTEVNAEAQNDVLALKLTSQRIADKNFSAAELRTIAFHKYGRFECSMKAAKGEGVITGFFLYRSSGKNPEIDIEVTGKNPRIATLNYWKNGKSSSHDVALSFDASAGFHEFAIVRSPGKITWEIDGRIVHTATENVPNEAMQLVLNIWASKTNEWAGKFNSSILPVQAEWKYVKILKTVF